MKEMLAEYVSGQAGWRADKADQYPEDDRNQRSADALWALAEHVERLPDDDPNLQALAALHEPWHTDVFISSEETGYMLLRFGFDSGHPLPDFDDFLTAFTSTLIAAVVKAEHEEAQND
ncbi:MAG: hypothetical protein H0U03_09690 [Actinobacteria bacterium]|nr:hypothetical protein [Actinomycetota bacterium]